MDLGQPNLERIGDRLAAKFKPNDFVRVINPDDEDYKFEFCREEVKDGDNRMSRIIDKFEIKAGQTAKLPGQVAYVYMDGIIKLLIQKNEVSPNMIIQPETQEKWINEVFVGKESVDALMDDLNVGNKKQNAVGRAENDPSATPAPNKVVEKTGSFSPEELGIDVGSVAPPEQAFPEITASK